MKMKELKNKGISLVILMMGADADYCEGKSFESEYDIARKTWASSLPDDVLLVYYDGGQYKETKIEDDGSNCMKLHLPCDDDMKWTFKKTWMAYKWVEENVMPKWTFRTNTSTYVNVDNLMKFIADYADSSTVYASDIYSLSEACTPWPLCLYPRGNGILLHHDLMKETIINRGMMFAFQGICDDIVIGNLLNSWFIQRYPNDKYYDRVKGLPHGWYKCVDAKFDNGHQLSKYGDDDIDYSTLITITVKKYREREKEEQHYIDLHEKVKADKDATRQINNHIELHGVDAEEIRPDKNWLSYMSNPSIFIGSILGYIDKDKWKEMDKNELYFLEISHKASDDEQHWIHKEIQGKKL